MRLEKQVNRDILAIVLRITFLVENMITQEQIARELGISVMTVYRCLSGNGCVGASNRKRIEEYVRKHNYRPNLMAQSLQRKSSNIIGLVVPSFTWSFYPDIIENIRTALGLQYNLVLALSGDCPDEERRALEMLARIPVSGILISPTDSRDSLANCHYLEEQHIPFVMFDRWFDRPGWSYVATDCFTGSVQLVTYLFGLGHRKIVHVGGGEGSFSRQMFEGYRRGLEICGLAFDPKLVFSGAADEKAGFAAMTELLESGREFTAVHTASDPIAVGVLNCCRERGISIPEQISVTGFSDIQIAGQLSVPLTTVKEPTAEIGREAVSILLGRISGKGTVDTHKLFPGTFIERNSCAALK